MYRFSVNTDIDGAILARYKSIKKWDLAILLVSNSKGDVRIQTIEYVVEGWDFIFLNNAKAMST